MKKTVGMMAWFVRGSVLPALFLISGTAQGEWVAAGGTVTNYSMGGTNYTAHIFLTSGPFVVNSNLTCDVLLVGGGGGGGETIGGGGGGGGVIASNAFNVAIGNYTVTVGSGGAGGWGTGYPAGEKGGDSILLALTAIGGGAGAGYNVHAVGTGGSAGGNGGSTGVRAGYTVDQGNDGGLGLGNNAGGGGGGAGQTGASASGSPVNGGSGGDGVTNSISGMPTAYAGGGGGGTRTGHGVGGVGGSGGGGAGGTGGNAGTNGTANTGGGGGGGGFDGEKAGGSGGSGIVIVRYLEVPVTITAPAVTNSGASNVLFRTATLQGQITDAGGDIPSVWFEYWVDGGASTSTVAMGPQGSTFTKWLTGLATGSTYQYRILASNTVGSVWSDQKSFSTGTGDSYYVATTGTGVGTNWATAFTSIQTALDTASDGEIIYIKGGTYSITNQLTWTQSGVTILGAYEGTNAVGPGDFSVERWPTVLGRPGSAGNTRIMLVSGVSGGTLSRLALTNGLPESGQPGGNLYVVGASNLTLSSLTVSGGYVSYLVPSVGGGGVFIANSTNVTLADSTIRDNLGRGSNMFPGGGVCATNTTLTITNCVILNNVVGYVAGGANQGGMGAGLYVRNCNATVVDTTIAGNYIRGNYIWTGWQGAGVYATGGTNVFRNCLIAGNNARFDQHFTNTAHGVPYGDGVYLLNGFSTFANCTIIRNNGQGIYYKGGTVVVTNSILWDNIDDLANFPTNSAGVLTNVWTSCIQDGSNDGENGCFSADPLFERGLYLATNSPCVNAGGSTVEEAGLSGYTTRADGTLDSGMVDLGYHFAYGILNTAVADLYVSPAGEDGNTGTNWTSAFRSISKALSIAEHGTQINIATGLYNSAVETFPLTIDRTFGLELLGTNTAATVITPISGKRGFYLSGVGYVRLQGLTVTGGSYPSGNDKGIGIASVNSRLTIDSCVISSNVLYSGYGGGAGLWMKDTFLTMKNSTIARNTINYSGYRPSLWQGYGGGLLVEGGELTLQNSLVSGNFAAAGTQGPSSIAAGGGIAIVGNYGGSRHTISNCVFIGNSIACLNNSRGAGLYIVGKALVANCLFATNWIVDGSRLGAGVFVGYDAGVMPPAGYVGVVGADFATLVNCTIVNNSPEGVRQNTTTDSLAIRNSILWNNGDDLFSSNMTATLDNLWYSNIEDGDNAGTNGCISADPLFANPTNDFHLKSKGGRWTPGDVWVNDDVDSPCIDAGDPAADYAMEPRPNGGRVNMGAYGNTLQASKTFVPRGTLILFR